MKRPHQSGSVFFLILIGIAMFGALSYAMIKGGSSSMSTLSDDQARLAAQEMISFDTIVQKAVQTMRLRGVEEYGLDFSDSTYTTVGGTPVNLANNTCTNDTCKVFNIAGGKVNAMLPPDNAGIDSSALPSNYWKPAHPGFRITRVQGVGTDAADVVLFRPFINIQVCKKINQIVGVTNPSDRPPWDPEDAYVPYSGTLTNIQDPGGLGQGNNATGVIGKTTFCTENWADAFYMYSVIIAR
jgi:hypothetical protein